VKRLGFLSAGLLGTMLIITTACGGGAETTPTPTPRSSPGPATPTPAVRVTPSPIATTPIATTPSGTTTAGGLDIGSRGEELKFDQDSLTATAGAPVTVRFRDNSASQQHNWVLVRPGTKDAVANYGLAAGAANDWIQQGDTNVIASTRLANAGQTVEVQFTAPAAGTYQYLCTFPGHNAAGMFGDFRVQ